MFSAYYPWFLGGSEGETILVFFIRSSLVFSFSKDQGKEGQGISRKTGTFPLFFGYFFLLFSGGGRNQSFSYFSSFGGKARKPLSSRRAGSQPNISTLAIIIRHVQSSQKASLAIPTMNFPECLGSAFCLGFLYSFKGMPSKFPGLILTTHTPLIKGMEVHPLN